MRWIDGTTYKGQWVNGEMCGKGTMKFPDGTVRKGKFKNNKFVKPQSPKADRKITIPRFKRGG